VQTKKQNSLISFQNKKLLGKTLYGQIIEYCQLRINPTTTERREMIVEVKKGNRPWNYIIVVKSMNGMEILRSYEYGGDRNKQSALKMFNKLKLYMKNTEFKDLT
jgi:hypothetical protein